MQILITDYHCASNRGDAAILEGELAALRKQFPDAKFTVVTQYPEAAQTINGVDAVRQRAVPFNWLPLRKNAAMAYLLATAPLRRFGLIPPKTRAIVDRLGLQPYLEADIVVSTGGMFLTEIYFPNKYGVLWELLFATALGTPTVVYAQTLGPFEDESLRSRVSWVLNRIDLITTRDARSKKILEDIGVTDTPVQHTADAAFAMPETPPKPKPIQRGSNAQSGGDLSTSGNLDVSISTREWSHFESEDGAKTYKQALAATADWLIEEHDASVTFLSTCTGWDSYHKDDRIITYDIVDRMSHSNSERITIDKGEYTPYELRNRYGWMDLHIGTRMHSNILAMLAETPVVAIGYQFKTADLMEQFGLTEWVIDIEDVTTESMIELVDSMVKDKEATRQQIRERLPEVKSQAERNAELVAEYYRAVSPSPFGTG
ncbi:polysaccharide pyruvyl transferase family protein [Saliphagus sp. LR7]|uniref:polysaccharide pyruvyl transferase family protein n=1 Tax=Saliphagus sp. LR7 TaxID=2282654 RepID=UPI001300A172|nr:polysaccharide pyruvyl transferase family protein [Saliphagus sp. LR7]